MLYLCGQNNAFFMPPVLKVCKIYSKIQLRVWNAGVGKYLLDGRLYDEMFILSF